jgi:sulfide:quinone oxidoreductase
MEKYDVVIIGAGTGGIMTAAQLRKGNNNLTVAIIDKAEMHVYQAAYTLVGAGTFDYEKTKEPTVKFIPSGVTWLKDFVCSIEAKSSIVKTTDGKEIEYRYLVVSPGVQVDLDAIPGLREAIDQKVVCSNYVDPRETWKQIQAFKGGTALFTLPSTPIKCGGAPQKTAYLATDYWKNRRKMSNFTSVYAAPGSVIFGVEPIKKTLMEVIDRYGIDFKPLFLIQRIDSTNKTAHFKFNGTADVWDILDISKEKGAQKLDDQVVSIPFDFMHLAPPQKAPEFLKTSGLTNDAGWVDVDINTLQHNEYKNIFGIGDAAGLPTAKTGAAIRKQVPVVISHILSLEENGIISDNRYYGYSSCPLVTGYGKMVLAEFDYQNNFTPDPKLKQLLVFNSDKEHRRLWMLKKYALPYLYWNKMLKGEKV